MKRLAGVPNLIFDVLIFDVVRDTFHFLQYIRGSLIGSHIGELTFVSTIT